MTMHLARRPHFLGALLQDVTPCSTPLFWMFRPPRVLKILLDRSSTQTASSINPHAKGVK